jgi:hypothetical protein
MWCISKPHCGMEGRPFALHSVRIHLYANIQFYNEYSNVNESLTEVSEYWLDFTEW